MSFWFHADVKVTYPFHAIYSFSLLLVLPGQWVSPVVLHGDLLPRPDRAPGLHPDAVPGLQREPGVTHAAVVTQGEGGEYAATLDTWKQKELSLTGEENIC